MKVKKVKKAKIVTICPSDFKQRPKCRPGSSTSFLLGKFFDPTSGKNFAWSRKFKGQLASNLHNSVSFGPRDLKPAPKCSPGRATHIFDLELRFEARLRSYGRLKFREKIEIFISGLFSHLALQSSRARHSAYEPIFVSAVA